MSSDISSDNSEDDSSESFSSPSCGEDDETYSQFLRTENLSTDSDSEHESSEALCTELTAAVVKNNIDEIKNLINLNAPKLFSAKDNFGYTLLQESMRRKNKELFDYMITLEDLDLECVNCFGETALMVALGSSAIDYIHGSTVNNIQLNDHYAYELIKKGAFIHSVCADGDTFLHRALIDSSVRVTTLLLEKGINVNAQDKRGFTPLHRLLIQGSQKDDHELFAALMYYGADPWIESKHEYTPFEFAVKYDNIFPIQETLFNYTFDKYTRSKIHLDVLLLLARNKSPFFYHVIEHINHIIVDGWKLDGLFYSLSQIDEVYVRVLLDKCDVAISAVIATTHVGFGLEYEKIFEAPFTPERLRNFNIVMESKVQSDMLDYIGTLKNFCYTITCDYVKVNESTATALVLYMLSYGLNLRENDLQTVYRWFGYCDLFKILLQMDFLTDLLRFRYSKFNIIPSLIYNVNIDLEFFLRDPRRYGAINVDKLLDYFVHPELTTFLQKCLKGSYLSEETDTQALVRKIANQPRVPILVELSRNAFRKFFIDKFQIKTGRRFVTLMNSLQISPVHKRIIMYETKLY